MRPVPDACLDLLHQFEGSAGKPELQRALDPVGNWEIGYSHKLSGPGDPLWNSTITPAQADALADQDLAVAAADLCNDLGDAVNALTDNRYAALIDFVYNEGFGHWHGSTLRVFVKQQGFAQVPAELAKWIYGGGRVLPGLVRRRKAETDLWNT